MQVEDSSVPIQSATATLSITITGVFRIVTTTLPVANEGVFYSTPVVASGGTMPYTFSIAAGGLFPGLSMGPNGVISGNVPVGIGGAAGFDVQVKDSSSPPQTVTGGLTLTVVAPLTITTTSLPPAILNTYYYQAIGVSGGVPLYYFDIPSGSLPPGLSLSFGVISGTPTKLGTSNFIIRVTDSANPREMARAKLSITVNNPPAQPTTNSPPPAGPLP